MSVTEERPRPDLSALRIHREDDDAKSVAWGTIAGWIIALVVVLGAAYAIYVLSCGLGHAARPSSILSSSSRLST